MHSEADANVWGIIFAIYGSFSFLLLGKFYWQEFIKKTDDPKLIRIGLVWGLGLVVLSILYQAEMSPLAVLYLALFVVLPFALKDLANKNRAKAGLAPWTFKSAVIKIPRSWIKVGLLGCAWLIYVIVRTNFYLEVLGISLEKWDEDYFVINTVLGVFAIFCMFNFPRIKSLLLK